MRRLSSPRLLVPALCMLSVLGAAPRASATDLREAVPSDVYLATYHRHNPERDYQKQYWDDVWNTVEQTRLFPKLMQLIEDRLPQDARQQFSDVRKSITDALEPVNWQAIADCSESVYAQRMEIPTSQHLVLLRLPDDGASGLAAGLTNLFKLLESSANGNVTVVSTTESGFELSILQTPPQVPLQVCVGSKDDVFVFATTRDFARSALALLADPSAESKFDDKRVALARESLPEMEDGITFFDGRALFRQLRQLPQFLRNVSGGSPDVERPIRLINTIFDQVDIPDFEITVEYTEGYSNRSATLGRVVPDFRDTVLGKMFANQEPFEQWGRWVPASASGFALSSGADLHELYAWIMQTIPEQFPEAQPGLDRFAELQDQYDLHLDADILQAFSGKSVSITLPGTTPTPLGTTSQSVVFLRCEKPERIRELLHRLIDRLQQIPQLKSQQITLTETPDMEGFEALSASAFALLGLRPVIGFHEGWMVIGSHQQAVQTVLKTQAGENPTFADSSNFERFGLNIDGPVAAIRYRNLGDSTRSAAQALQQVGLMLPMLFGMAGQDTSELKPLQDFVALLPSLGQIVGTLDFYESQLTVIQPGNDRTYTKHSVILIRPPAEGKGTR